MAIHELGHSLGLGHSQTQNSVMFAFYRGPTLNVQELPEDDRVGIQQLYGKYAKQIFKLHVLTCIKLLHTLFLSIL